MVGFSGPRALGTDEWVELSALLKACFRPQGGRMEACFPFFLSEDNRENLRVIRTPEGIASHVGWKAWPLHLGGVTLQAGCIGAVCTQEAMRGHGFASALLRDVYQKAASEAVVLLVISGDRGLYQRHGAAACGSFERFKLPSSAVAAWSSEEVEVSLWQRSDSPAWASLHQGEAIRWGRPWVDWTRLLGSGRPPHRPHTQETLLTIRQGSLVTATVVLWERPHEVKIVEVAGSRLAAAAGIARWSKGRSHADLVWDLPSHDPDGLFLARPLASSVTQHPSDGIVVILRPDLLVSALTTWLHEGPSSQEESHAEEAGEPGKTDVREPFGPALCEALPPALWSDPMAWSNDTASLRWLGATTWPELSKLLFGVPPGEAPLVPIAGSFFDRWKTRFPLPRPLYGLSYL